MTHRRVKKLLTAATVILLAVVAAGCWWYFRPGGPAVTPSREEYPVRGIDISAHNGEIDFEALRADSIDFVIIKATEGTSFKDAAFVENYRKAREAGFRVGAYHFFRFDAPGYMQALNFLHSITGRELDMPLVIDIEEWSNPDDRTTESIISQLRVLIEQLEQAGYDVMLYSNRDGYDRFLHENLDNYPLWIASLRGEPATETWHLWQFTHRGSVSGVDGNVDINTFRGSREDWENWMNELERQKQ